MANGLRFWGPTETHHQIAPDSGEDEAIAVPGPAHATFLWVQMPAVPALTYAAVRSSPWHRNCSETEAWG